MTLLLFWHGTKQPSGTEHIFFSPVEVLCFQGFLLFSLPCHCGHELLPEELQHCICRKKKKYILTAIFLNNKCFNDEPTPNLEDK